MPVLEEGGVRCFERLLCKKKEGGNGTADEFFFLRRRGDLPALASGFVAKAQVV
jgi:hypothetical protein